MVTPLQWISGCRFRSPTVSTPAMAMSIPRRVTRCPINPVHFEDASPGRGEVIGRIHQPTRHDEDKATPGQPGKIVEDRRRTK